MKNNFNYYLEQVQEQSQNDPKYTQYSGVNNESSDYVKGQEVEFLKQNRNVTVLQHLVNMVQNAEDMDKNYYIKFYINNTSLKSACEELWGANFDPLKADAPGKFLFFAKKYLRPLQKPEHRELKVNKITI